MTRHRVLVEPGVLVAGTTVTLSEEENNHLRVRRATAGDTVELFDGAGATAEAVLSRAGKGWQANVESVAKHSAASTLILAVGAGDRDRFLALAEKCTELGVTRLIPLITERSAQVETRLRESGAERARKRAREACKQSGNPWATVVDELTPLDQLPGVASSVRWLLADPSGNPISPIDHTPGHAPLASTGWLIGPEGGFAEAEAAMLQERLDATPVRLTPHVLRFETAAVVAAALARLR